MIQIRPFVILLTLVFVASHASQARSDSPALVLPTAQQANGSPPAGPASVHTAACDDDTAQAEPAEGSLERDSVLKTGATGKLVEDLQRTLNSRLEPSPDLGLDGDFGPATRQAVLRFQRANQLKPTGEVDAATWQALGPLVTQDDPVPAPDKVNGAALSKSKADPLDGPPFVTCKAWGVADGATGEFLWGSHEAEKRDFASTTKVMTALVVLTLAKDTPAVLGEVVTFSQRADETRGSSARIRAGESLTVEELLYGLLLPSGNDAAVALAEHFGGRFAPGHDVSDDPLSRFVAEMNRTAQRLEMKDTTYKNPHGLTNDGHVSTARDLLRLAHASLTVPRLAAYVSTRQRGSTLVGPSGYRRNVVWKNTNQLLPIAGYDGVKTGTTQAAGACLISSGRRANDHLLIVVLGATSGDARYVDTRNLYRWAWRQRTDGSTGR